MFDVAAVIFVIDSSSDERVSESYNELSKLVQEKELKEASLLILANKQVHVLDVAVRVFDLKSTKVQATLLCI